MMSELISVIIPVYKVEPYLTDCIESVLAQTYRNIEIILVDDGSPDRCPQICDAYARKDARIRVLHKENGGLSSARNAGVDIAKGEFIAFLDSDDLWSPVFLERLYTELSKANADFSVCLFKRFLDPKDIQNDLPADTVYLTQEEGFDCLFNARNVDMVIAVNKLYKASLFQEVRYPIGKLHEDEAVIHEIIGKANKIAWLQEVHYFYRTTPGSITTAAFNLKRLDETYAKETRISYFEERGMTSLAKRTKVVYLSNLMRLYRTVQYECKSKVERKQTCKKLHCRFLELYSKKLISESSVSMRIRCMLFAHMPQVYAVLETIRMKVRSVDHPA